MTKIEGTSNVVRFGVFDVDLKTGELRKQGLRLRLQEQPFKVLATLLSHPGDIVSREELVHVLWPEGTFVDFDRGLNAAVTRLRQVLGDSAERPRYVETVARRGYRFIAPVEEAAPTGAAQAAAEVPRSGHRYRWWAAAGAVAALGLLAFSVSRFRTRPVVELEQVTREPGLATDPAVSPDGKLLAYASDGDGRNLNIWVKQLAGDGSAVRLTRGTSDALQPAFSPDGSRIAYRSEQDGGGVYAVPVLGGEPVRLAAGGRNPRYSPDGKWIAYWTGHVAGPAPDGNAAGSVFVIPASGGEPKQIGRELPPGGDPIWSPDSKELLVQTGPWSRATAAEANWWAVPLDGGMPRRVRPFSLVSENSASAYSAGMPRASSWQNGSLVFSAPNGDGRSIWRVAFRPDDFSISGKPERLTLGTALDVNPFPTSGDALVFASMNRRLAIWKLPIQANTGKVFGQLQAITDGANSEITPALSRDGSMLAYGSAIADHEDIRLKDLQTGKDTAIAASSSAEWHPAISRDGAKVAYTVDDASSRGLYVVSVRDGKRRRIAARNGWIMDWSPDGLKIIFHPNCEAGSELDRIDLQSGVESKFLARPGMKLYQLKFSPDGRWLVVEAVASTPGVGNDDSRLFVVKIENGLPARGADWIPVSDEHGWSDKPRWSPDGNSLYFISDRDGYLCIWWQRLDPASKRPVGAPVAIYHFHQSRFSPKNVGSALSEIDVASDKIVMNLGQLTGNIWKLSRH